VLENGAIVEDGSHAELMMKNGKYATMFAAQADPYQEKESSIALRPVGKAKS
jgi:ABC-type transport system involved in cytochrome bd biosynthesis fused ATPase/permease subunit